jgi:hypothetical protein
MTCQRRLVRSSMLAAALILSGAASASDTVTRKFESGSSGSNTVGIVDAAEDVELNGPEALTSDEKGNLFILDQINGRVLRFNPKETSNEPDVLKLPDSVQPTDLVVRKNNILVWDGTVRTLKTADEPSTRGVSGGDTIRLEEVSVRDVDDRFAISAFSQMGSQQPGSASDLLDQNTRAVVTSKARPTSRQYVSSRGKGSVVADVIPDKGLNSVRIEVRTVETNEAVAQLNLRVRGRLGAVEFLEIDYANRLYVLAENIPDTVSGAATFVARYASSGKLEGVYELPLANTPLTRRFVTISGDGDVYFLRTKPSDIEVVGVGFRSLRETAVIDVRPPAAPSPFSAFFANFNAIAAVRPSNRQQVIETAFAFEGLQWKLTAANYGSDPDSACSGFNRIRRPWYLQGKVNQEVRGVPYCWGCFGSLANFRFQMDRGTKAGNVCTHNAPRPDVAGVDCSAFVSATWGLSVHYTTAAIPAIAKPLGNPWDLKPGDALNKPGSHVMLFLRFTPDRKAEVMESSTGGCNGRVCRNVYPLAALLARGYVPVRFRALSDDQTVVSANAYQEKEPPAAPAKKGRKR